MTTAPDRIGGSVVGMDGHERAVLAAECEAALRRDVLAVWFPRCLDSEHGGFFSEFDHAWRRCQPDHKLLEFQARQTWLAARAMRAYPGEPTLRTAALHGFRYLRDVMWDAAQGGWFHRCTREGAPLEAETKHAHGIAYAIQACVAVHEATGDAGALELAGRGFEWLEQHAHDHTYGGYHGYLTRGGMPITDTGRNPLEPAEWDTIGTPVGVKDVNVHSDFVDALTDLYRASGDTRHRARLEEVVAIVRDRTVAGNGAMHMYFAADWKPFPDLVRYGHEIQSARRLARAQELLGGSAEPTRRVVLLLVRHATERAWDPTAGGFRYAGSAFGPVGIEGRLVVVPDKVWWVQAEALHTLLFMAVHEAEPAVDYLGYFRRQWRYIQGHLIDRVRHGWNHAGCDGRGWCLRIGRRASASRKGHLWKDGSHEGLALLGCVRLLRGLSEGAPL